MSELSESSIGLSETSNRLQNEELNSKSKSSSDYKSKQQQRIQKLKNILSKSYRLRKEEQIPIKLIRPKISEPQKILQKRSLPLIQTNKQYQKFAVSKTNFQQTFCQYLRNKESSQKHEIEPKLEFSNQIISKALEGQPDRRFPLNPQSHQNQSLKSYLKLKIKYLNLQQQIQKQQSSFKRDKSSSTLQQSLSRVKIQKLASKSPYNQRQEKNTLRRKKRDISELNLAKIQHLPQIIFPKNKKCSRAKFPSLSMAQIDNNLLVDEIFYLKEKSMIQMKNRQIKEKLFKTKMQDFRNQSNSSFN